MTTATERKAMALVAVNGPYHLEAYAALNHVCDRGRDVYAEIDPYEEHVTPGWGEALVTVLNVVTRRQKALETQPEQAAAQAAYRAIHKAAMTIGSGGVCTVTAYSLLRTWGKAEVACLEAVRKRGKPVSGSVSVEGSREYNAACRALTAAESAAKLWAQGKADPYKVMGIVRDWGRAELELEALIASPLAPTDDPVEAAKKTAKKPAKKAAKKSVTKRG